MNVLIIGSGGREHALAWQCARFDEVKQIYVAPGNAGTELEPTLTNVPISEISELIEFAKHNKIDITIVGPEAPLVAGIVDAFVEHGLAIFGPNAYCAQLEGSKAFSKQFMLQHNIPTAFYKVFTKTKEAVEFVKTQSLPIVIKADGLAAGKGVIIAHTFVEAVDAITDMLEDNMFGEAGSRVIIEEFLHGEEASFIVMSDGKHILPMATSQDHKARDNGDMGPNTGGMGAYSPAPVVTEEIYQKAMTDVIEPVIRGMAEHGTPYVGFLYAGLMIHEGDIKVLEFNCRFGDPETQPIMMRLDSNLAQLCLAATKGELDTMRAKWNPQSALGVVLASAGYPFEYQTGNAIQLPEQSSPSQKVFHAGTHLDDGVLVNSGGRVLCATALGDTITEASSEAYALVSEINWKGSYFRTDIGYKAIQK